jgi:hypothetical protein
MKYGGEFCERRYCGTLFKHIGDENDEGDSTNLPVSTEFRRRKIECSSEALHGRFL